MAEWKFIDRGLWKMRIDGVVMWEIICLIDGTFDAQRRRSAGEAEWDLIGNYPDFQTAKATAEKLEADRERERKLDEPGTFYVVSKEELRTVALSLRNAIGFQKACDRSYGVKDDEPSKFIIVTPVTI